MRTISHLSILSWICSTEAAARRPFVPHHQRMRPPSLPLLSDASPWPSLRAPSAISIAIDLPRGGSDDLGDSVEFNSDDDDDVDDEHERGSPPQTSLQRSISSLSSVFTQTIYPHAASLLLRIRRSCLAGWEAAWNDQSQTDSRQSHTNNQHRRHRRHHHHNGTDLPKLHSFLGKAGHVLHQMYLAALADNDGTDNVAAHDTRRLHLHAGLQRNTKRRSASNAATDTKRHHERNNNKRGHHKRKSTPTAIVCNGGGIDHTDTTHRHTSSEHQRAISSLAQKYGVSNTDQIQHSSVFTSTHTSFNEILQKANAEARFLICYISSESLPQNNIVIPSLLHAQFTKLCKRKPLGKKNLQDTGSFYVWICTEKAVGEEVKKRLKIKPIAGGSTTTTKKKKQKTAPPILTIIHPANTVDSSNRLKVSPRILVQHHCNPPPASLDTLTAWVTSIRKRHLREYAKLQHDRKEILLMKERSEGYMRSMEEDAIREQKQKEEMQRKKEEEDKIQKRREQMEQRRVELLESLPEEPENGEGVITVALRFQSVPSNAAASTQRRFSKNDSMNDVFNWIDATHGLERETLILSTMNGSRSFRYAEDKGEKDDQEEEEEIDGRDAMMQGENMTLEEAGLGRMTALRVTKIATEDSVPSESSEN